jgi:transposase
MSHNQADTLQHDNGKSATTVSDPKVGGQADTLQPNHGKSATTVPDPEVAVRAEHRHFTAEYKQRILQEADGCTRPGQVGALLRRENLYSSHLTTWRQQRTRGELQGLTPAKRGRKADPQAAEIARLRQENERLKARLERAELIIEVQKKVSQMLGLSVTENDASK